MPDDTNATAAKGAEAAGRQPRPEDDDSVLITEVVRGGTTYDDFTTDAVVLWGYLLDLDDNHWRLYFTPEFTEYVDFLKGTVDNKGEKITGDYVHHIHVTNSAIGGTIVWVRRSARLRHTVVRSAAQVADFLRGQISVNFLSQTGVGNAIMQSAVQRGRQRRDGEADVNVSLILGGCGTGAAGGPCPG